MTLNTGNTAQAISIAFHKRGNEQTAVDARELHAALGSKQQFANWIKNRIEKYGFIENQDFEVFNNFVKNPSEVFLKNENNPSEGGRPAKQYILSLDMAKELAMVENNEKGRQVRLYFIAKEKELREKASSFHVPLNFREALLLAAQQQEQIEEQQRQIDQSNHEILELSHTVSTMEKKVTYMDKIFACQSTVKVKTIAQDYGMSAIAFNKLLHNHGIQYKCGDVWVLYAKYLQEGYVKDVSFGYEHKDGTTGVRCNTQWTQKGRAFLYQFLKEKGILPLIEKN